jgi:alkanesulfonate monooxygenase SsuD/methylene tetrahydromethanopterin reductase-like flavin-dependent oxidoreductase (luciferase family)
MDRGLRFGVVTLQNAPCSALMERWRYLDELDFDSAWVADHFVNPFSRASPYCMGGGFCRPSPHLPYPGRLSIADSGHDLSPTMRPQSRWRL